MLVIRVDNSKSNILSSLVFWCATIQNFIIILQGKKKVRGGRVGSSLKSELCYANFGLVHGDEGEINMARLRRDTTRILRYVFFSLLQQTS